MRAEERKLDRQITSEGCAPGCHLDGPPPWLTPPPPTPEIKNEETKVKQSVKQAVKRGDTSTAKMLAKEIVRSRKATARLYTSKAQMNSVVMQMQNQLGAPGRRPSAAPRPRRRTCCLTAARHSGLWVCPRSATKGDGAHGEEHGGHGRDEPPRQGRRHQEHDAGDAEGDDEGARAPARPPAPEAPPPVRRRGALPCTEASRRLPHAACPVACPQAGLIDEMIDDQMDDMDEADEEAADEEVMKVMEELNAVNTGGMTSAPTSQVQQQGGAAAAEDDAEEEQMRARLQELRG